MYIKKRMHKKKVEVFFLSDFLKFLLVYISAFLNFKSLVKYAIIFSCSIQPQQTVVSHS